MTTNNKEPTSNTSLFLLKRHYKFKICTLHQTTMPHTITQYPEDLAFDSEGFPQIPLTETARRLRDLTSSSNNIVKVKSHYRRRKASKKKSKSTEKKQTTKTSPLDGWLLPSVISSRNCLAQARGSRSQPGLLSPHGRLQTTLPKVDSRIRI